MKILGLQKLTLLDYPGHIAAIVFLGGCNFRCPFCQNSSLVLTPDQLPEISRDEFLRFLRKRAGILEGVCVTGGEPCIHPELPGLLEEIRQTGLLVKLDTNGTNPDMLAALLNQSRPVPLCRGLRRFGILFARTVRENKPFCPAAEGQRHLL